MIDKVITILAQDFARSRNANHRKGGLIGLAAIALGLLPVTIIYVSCLFFSRLLINIIVPSIFFILNSCLTLSTNTLLCILILLSGH